VRLLEWESTLAQSHTPPIKKLLRELVLIDISGVIDLDQLMKALIYLIMRVLRIDLVGCMLDVKDDKWADFEEIQIFLNDGSQGFYFRALFKYYGMRFPISVNGDPFVELYQSRGYTSLEHLMVGLLKSVERAAHAFPDTDFFLFKNSQFFIFDRGTVSWCLID
jgi:hypothetical protein